MSKQIENILYLIFFFFFKSSSKVLWLLRVTSTLNCVLKLGWPWESTLKDAAAPSTEWLGNSGLGTTEGYPRHVRSIGKWCLSKEASLRLKTFSFKIQRSLPKTFLEEYVDELANSKNFARQISVELSPYVY